VGDDDAAQDVALPFSFQCSQVKRDRNCQEGGAVLLFMASQAADLATSAGDRLRNILEIQIAGIDIAL
jgi:hypothetical protein